MSDSPPAPDDELAPLERAGSSVGLAVMAAARRALLEHLKREGEASAGGIAGALGVTVGAIRQQLATLEGDGLVAHRDERSGRGRPRRWYCLTPKAEGLWPHRYGQLANHLLGVVEESAPELVTRAFERRQLDRAERARARLVGQGFEERVHELAAILDEDGYLATCERGADGRWLVVEHNCAIADVAVRHGVACSSELAFLRGAMPDAEIERVQHRMAGGHVCAYAMAPAVGDRSRGEPLEQ